MNLGILNTLTRLLLVLLFYFMFLNSMQVQFWVIGREEYVLGVALVKNT